jgi:hypothetical protein
MYVIRHRNNILAVGIVGLALVLILTISTLITVKSYAAPVQGFEPGNIMDEPTFLNTGSMTAIQIQNFLSSKVPVCDTQGTQVSEFGGGTRAQWAASRGYSPPFTCLKDYTEGGRGAAQIIYDVAQAYQINPQVLIVLLQKEQALVTDTWPLATQYRTATGYGCPDTAACDSQYFGLTNQITWAARMFKAIITASPTWYTPYVLGNNFIQWSPNSSCGGTTVNIQNRSTQALYNYTPYQPNQAALNAGYGTGDGCSAYGNRNFYQYFKDWFGPTRINSTFLRTVDNGTLFLVEGLVKHPIADITIFDALYPLGGVGYVSQTYLDSLTTGPTMGRVIRANDGTVYFYDAGIKLPFGSCTLVEAYGSSCGAAVTLRDTQMNTLSNGPSMTNVLKTTSGKTFYMDGTKREVYDQTSLAILGASISGANTLNESSLNNLLLGAPVIRDNVFAKSRSSGSLFTYANNQLSRVNQNVQTATYLNTLNVPSFDSSSLILLAATSNTGGYLRSSGGTNYILVPAGKLRLSDVTDWNQTFVTISDTLLAQIPDTGSIVSPPYTIKSSGSGTIYGVVTGEKRPIASWRDLLFINPSPSILTLPDYYLNNLTNGVRLLAPGQLVKSPTDGTVYMIDGLASKITMTNFQSSSDLGFSSLLVVQNDILNKYTTASGTLQSLVQCGASRGIAANGSVYTLNLSGGLYTTLSDSTCSLLIWKSIPGFILSPTGTIYQLSGTQKLPITSYQTYLSLGGTSNNTVSFTNYAVSLIPTGPSI